MAFRARNVFGTFEKRAPESKQEVRESWTFGSSTQTQKLETIGVVNGYKNGPSLPLRISWKWPTRQHSGQTPGMRKWVHFFGSRGPISRAKI